MITAVIIDDVQKNVSLLVNLLQQYCPEVVLLGTANNAETGKALIERLKPQVIFLDIEMPYGNGFDLLRSMPGMDADVIFITAYEQYAINAFRFAALDYLLKPVNVDELMMAVKHAGQRIKEKKASRNYDLWLSNLNEKDIARQCISLNENGQQYIVRLADIMYIIADGSYTNIYTTGKMLVSTKNLKYFEDMFPADVFSRIHHGHMINKAYVVKIKKGRGGVVSMKDGRDLEISFRRKDKFLKMMHK